MVGLLFGAIIAAEYLELLTRIMKPEHFRMDAAHADSDFCFYNYGIIMKLRAEREVVFDDQPEPEPEHVDAEPMDTDTGERSSSGRRVVRQGEQGLFAKRRGCRWLHRRS
jgi:hypothetical protein